MPVTRTERLLAAYRDLQGDLLGTGQERRSFETPREHAGRVGPAADPPVSGAFGTVIPMIDEGLYGQTEISDADLAVSVRALDVLKRALR